MGEWGSIVDESSISFDQSGLALCVTHRLVRAKSVCQATCRLRVLVTEKLGEGSRDF